MQDSSTRFLGHGQEYQHGITVTEHLLLREEEFPEATGQFTRLLSELIIGAKLISREINKAGLVEILGLTGDVNVQGEEVRKLDEFADRALIWRMQRAGLLCAISSEENEGVIEIPDNLRNRFANFRRHEELSSLVDTIAPSLLAPADSGSPPGYFLKRQM